MVENSADTTAKKFPAVDTSRYAVVLVRPETPANVGLAARGMANTGFRDLRIVGSPEMLEKARITAVHAGNILDGAGFFEKLEDALAGINLVFGSTSRRERGFPLIGLGQAVERIREYPQSSKVGIVFGNERTGLTAGEMSLTNFRFRIPQAARQPSYNLGMAVTLVLFALASGREPDQGSALEVPLSHEEQLAAGLRFKELLDHLGFMKRTNRDFISAKVQDIFMRMTMTAKERDIIQAMFRKAVLASRKDARKDKTGKKDIKDKNKGAKNVG
jgi:tRNA/rRNA methyltransferase